MLFLRETAEDLNDQRNGWRRQGCEVNACDDAGS